MSTNFRTARALKRTGAALGLALSAWLPVQAAALRLTCPRQVTAASANVVDVPEPWKPHGRARQLSVVSAGFSDGPPADAAWLKPHETRSRGATTVVKWKFEELYPKGRWLACEYEGGLFSLTRELPADTSECIVTYEKPKSGNMRPETVDCK